MLIELPSYNDLMHGVNTKLMSQARWRNAYVADELVMEYTLISSSLAIGHNDRK